MPIYDKAKHISRCLELAILFEISADKPGNVNLIVGFEGTRYEHFLASAVAATSSFELAARQGIAVSRCEAEVSSVGLGRIIKDCVRDIGAWQRGGNTLLGTVLLLSPLAVAAGMASTEKEYVFKLPHVREKLRQVVRSTTPEDAVQVYEAIRIANPSGLGTVPELDINDSNSEKRILEQEISLYTVFKLAEKHDNICYEWTNDYTITFDTAHPFLVEQIKKIGDLNMAVIHTFLKVLGDYPDTFIARKVGMDKASEVSAKARRILKLGGLETKKGTELLHEFDLQLRQSDSLLNPGTTADIIAAALALCVLSGYRP
jgi:triphosphoribosyl-dephospho-CoA synthase